MRATLSLKRITLLFDYGETILLNCTNTFDTKYKSFNTRESNKQVERINLRYKIIIVSMEQWKKKREKKREKRRSGEFFIEYRITKHAWFIFYKLTLVSVQTRTLVPPYEHLLLILSSVISIFYFVKYPPSFFSFSSIYRQLNWSVN